MAENKNNLRVGSIISGEIIRFLHRMSCKTVMNCRL